MKRQDPATVAWHQTHLDGRRCEWWDSVGIWAYYAARRENDPSWARHGGWAECKREHPVVGP